MFGPERLSTNFLGSGAFNHHLPYQGEFAKSFVVRHIYHVYPNAARSDLQVHSPAHSSNRFPARMDVSNDPATSIRTYCAWVLAAIFQISELPIICLLTVALNKAYHVLNGLYMWVSPFFPE